MCGRYRLSRRKQLIEEYFEANGDAEMDWQPRYNVAPSQDVAIIRQDRSARTRSLSLAHWGLIPHWSQDASVGYKMINARSETVTSKPAFKEAFLRRRCLIPADGFYEWQRAAKTKQPFHFGMSDDSLFAFAGLWDRWKDANGQTVESCSILTTAPNSLLSDVHDRMPVILAAENYDVWLDPGFRDAKSLLEMLRPFVPAAMKRYPVSSRVNSVTNDDQLCVAPVPVLNEPDPTAQHLRLI